MPSPLPHWRWSVFGNRCLLLAAAGFLLATAPALPAAESATYPDLVKPLSQRQPLKVAASDDSFPYAYGDGDGRWTGFSADLLEAVARTMHLEFQRFSGPGREMQERFRLGEFDLIQSYSQTQERETYADFSVPYLTLQGAIFVRTKDSPIKRLSDFNGQKFAIIGSRSIGERFLNDHHLAVLPVYVSSSEQGLRQVESGECAGVFVSALTALAVQDRFGLKNVKMFGAPLADYDIRHCFAVHKGDAALLARLNEGLAILHRNGEYEKIHRKWFGSLDGPLITREQALNYIALALAVGCIIAGWGWMHQRSLRRRISTQTAELSAQRAVLQAIYDNIPFGLTLLERAPDGWHVLALNRQSAPWFGIAPKDANGQLLGSLKLEPDWERHLEELLARFAPGSGFLREERALTTARKRLLFTLVPLAPGPEAHPRCCVLTEDVTERRHLDEEVAQSRKLRAVGELVGGIAHEFNNLLTPIMLKVGEIRLDWSADGKLHGELDLITGAVQRAAELTRRLLTFGRKTDVRIEAVTLGKAVDNCFALLRLTVDRRILWENAVPASLSPLFFNATDLNQIILNLILNARDTLMEKLALHRDGWTPMIRVEAEQLPADAIAFRPHSPSSRQVVGWQRLTVRDNGMGMVPEVRERIFEPFYTTKEVGHGTGLGLATVWHLVTEVSGRIEVESTIGDGTAFHVYLPVLPVPGEKSAAPISAVPATTLQDVRVFLAEDDTLVAAAVLAALRRAGLITTHFANGADAWQHLQQNFNAYDLLVLDVNMPGLDGIELAQRVRNSGKFHGQLMIVSGRLSSSDLRQLSETRVDRVLTKPFEIDEFLSAIRECLDRSSPAARLQRSTTSNGANPPALGGNGRGHSGNGSSSGSLGGASASPTKPSATSTPPNSPA